MEDRKMQMSLTDPGLPIFNRQSSIVCSRSSFRSGFSFAEVMFAVVILGIGFIMVAAIFPVAIQQTQSTGEENIAALAARDAADAIISLPATLPNPAYLTASNFASVTAYNVALTANPAIAIQNYLLFPPSVKNYVIGSTSGSTPPPAIVVPFNGTRWKMVQSDTIVVSDQRYAYVPFYRRENGSNAAELIVISLAVRNKSVYVTVNDAMNSHPTVSVTTTAVLNPPPVGGVSTPPAQQSSTVIYPDVIAVSSPSSNGLVEGSSVIAPTPSSGSFAGRTYTLGRVTNSGYEISAGDGLALTAGTTGSWGTVGATNDLALAGQLCTYNNSTTLQPQVAYATLQSTPTNPAGQITLFASPTNGVTPLNIGPGAFVIVADDFPLNPASFANVAAPAYSLPPNNTTYNPPFIVGSMNGRIFRLSSVVGAGFGAGTTYNLDPAYGMRLGTNGGASPDTLPSPSLPQGSYLAGQFGAKVYIVGIGQVNGTYTGVSQDIGVFATYFPVK